MTPCRPPMIRSHHPLVLRKINLRRPVADSPLQLLSLHHGEGEADRGVKWFVWGVGTAKRQRSQQRACRFRNLCESNRRIQLIDEYGTCRYIKQRGGLEVTLHQNVLSALEHRALCYQNSKSYKELEDKCLMDEAIDETETVPRSSAGDDEESRVIVEEQLRQEIREVADYLLEVHGLPPGRKGEGITRLIY